MVSTPAQQATWRDPSPHRVALVTVDEGVDLEVLDWGGSGRPIVLLAGLGNTAHVFDDFAPKLTASGHVYGVTRRGYGVSTRPAGSYGVDRLAADVLTTLDKLSLEKPVIVGHSIAGQELSALAADHPDRIGGLVYLDAGYRYAVFRPGIQENLDTLRKNLGLLDTEMKKGPRTPPELAAAIRAILGDSLTEFERDLEELTTAPPAPPAAPQPAAEDLKDFAAYRQWSMRVQGYALPEAELRQQRLVTPSGGVGDSATPRAVGQSVFSGSRRFTRIGVPALAIFASPHDLGPWTRSDPATRTAFEGFARIDRSMTDRQAAAFERAAPGSRVVRVPNASHHVFVTHEQVVLQELHAFLVAQGSGLKAQGDH